MREHPQSATQWSSTPLKPIFPLAPRRTRSIRDGTAQDMHQDTLGTPISADQMLAYMHQARRRPKSTVFRLTERKMEGDIQQLASAMIRLLQVQRRHLCLLHLGGTTAWTQLAGTHQTKAATRISFRICRLTRHSLVGFRRSLPLPLRLLTHSDAAQNFQTKRTLYPT